MVVRGTALFWLFCYHKVTASSVKIMVLQKNAIGENDVGQKVQTLIFIAQGATIMLADDGACGV